MPLFDRSGKKVSLTTTGEYMVVYARKILALLKDAEDASARLQRAEIGLLTVGMVSTAKYFMMRLLADFRERHAGVDIRICTGNREQLVKMLHNNEVDIAVMGHPPTELQTRAEPFAAHPHVFVSACDHPLAQREKLTAEDLRPYEFIVREQGSGTRAAMHKFFSERKVEPRLQSQVNSNETLKQAVMVGLGLGFVSLHTIGSELDHGEIAILDVQGTPVFRVWNIVHTLSKVLSPAAEAFRYEILERGEQFLAEKFGHHLVLP
jgi:DNA-binding transcriptional LysR family regulator